MFDKKIYYVIHGYSNRIYSLVRVPSPPAVNRLRRVNSLIYDSQIKNNEQYYTSWTYTLELFLKVFYFVVTTQATHRDAITVVNKQMKHVKLNREQHPSRGTHNNKSNNLDGTNNNCTSVRITHNLFIILNLPPPPVPYFY